MKKKGYLWLLTLFFLVACSQQEEIESSVEDKTPPESYVVSIGLSGEFIETTTESLSTRLGTPTNDVYGINVYYDKDDDDLINDLYAYGLFDNREDMTITLLSGHKYKFECSLIKDAKTTLFYGQCFGKAYSGFAYPFQTGNQSSTMVENRFIIGTSTYLTGIKNGAAHTASVTSPSTSNANSYASVNRFYGETTDYTPTQGGTVTIELKRVVFGAKFIIQGVAQGTLTASCGSFWSKTVTADDEGSTTIYTFPNVYDCWKNGTDLTATVNLSFVSDRGSYWNLSRSSSVTFKRNVMTTVTIDVTPDLSSGNINFTEEEMTVDNDINLGINSDGLIDVIVNPVN